MITKERLLELIEQGATIYYCSNEYWDNSGKIKIVEHKLTKNRVKDLGGIVEIISDRRFYETKEQAEWHREFGNIQRTERLELPTWEEIEKDFKSINKFGTYPVIDTYGLYMDIFVDNYCNKFIVLTTLPRMPLTKENYIKACRKAKELFLGGKDE